ncbi:putative membrane channel-forming protein YqfA (hemolysin III family) [Cytobacillus purgationiresistens]|uniref:Membrane channel-forming protein YqfA (Hemolysin III family) n=1 Tax=Cytobacillus purgationiresistens TaxID=863449 RepID=A0ABU0AD84_9BACI|nr:putative membrane channel-forming protein YqfA (hemolysin III family) [Cytobacillus purgationiresistens]
MDLLLIITILTLLLLLMSLLLIYSKLYSKTLGKLCFLIFIFACLSLPHISIIYNELSTIYRQNLMMISTVFMITWGITAICLLFGLLFRFGINIEKEA